MLYKCLVGAAFFRCFFLILGTWLLYIELVCSGFITQPMKYLFNSLHMD